MQAYHPAGLSADRRRVVGDHLILLALAIALMIPELVFGMSNTNSATYSIVWTKQYADAVANGQIYPRWLPDSFDRLGSPAFYFYPPFAYFVCGALSAAGLGAVKAVTAASACIFFASGVSMYAWLRWKGAPPLLGAILYMVAPYRVFDVYSRGAIAEHAAFIWFPLIALGIQALPRRWAAPTLAIALAGLVITHLPMALLALCLLVAPLAALRVRDCPRAIWPGAIAIAAGLGLAAFYLVPALTLQNYVKIQLLWTPLFRPSFWFIWRWDPVANIDLVFQAAACVALLVAAARPKSAWFWLAAISAAVAFGLLPITVLPGLSAIQFPWRALGLVVFFAASAIAAAPPRVLAAAVALCLVVPAYVDTSRHFARATLLGDRPPMARIVRDMPDAPEYLPRDLAVPGLTDDQNNPDFSAYANLPRGEVIEVTRPGRYAFGRFAFPIWRVTHDGADVPTDGPLLGFRATAPGEYRIERRVIWQEAVGAATSALALALLLALGLPAPARSRAVAWVWRRQPARLLGGG
jgi:hypothetical protein